MCRSYFDRLLGHVNAKKAGNQYMGHCPAHDDRSPSLSIALNADGRVLLHCFAGCPQESVIASLAPEGLSPPPADEVSRPPKKHLTSRPQSDHPVKPERSSQVRALARETAPAGQTVVQTYLTNRGITLPVPNALRYLPSLRHRSGMSCPAMIALVTRGLDDHPVALHRTWLTPDGRGKADVEPNRMALGPIRGGAVRLAPFSLPLMIGEGIEATLAAIQATGHCGWAALSASGIRSLDLPHEATDIIILADGDEAGTRAAHAAASRWHRQGRRVRIAQAPAGNDFNDLLLSGKEFGDR